VQLWSRAMVTYICMMSRCACRSGISRRMGLGKCGCAVDGGRQRCGTEGAAEHQCRGGCESAAMPYARAARAQIWPTDVCKMCDHDRFAIHITNGLQHPSGRMSAGCGWQHLRMSLQVSICYLENRLHRNDHAVLSWGFFQEVAPQLLASEFPLLTCSTEYALVRGMT
jgi:hypothetical protein